MYQSWNVNQNIISPSEPYPSVNNVKYDNNAYKTPTSPNNSTVKKAVKDGDYGKNLSNSQNV